MSKLIREVDVTISYGDIYANVTIEPQELPTGLRAKLHTVVDSIADQIGLRSENGDSMGLVEASNALITAFSFSTSDVDTDEIRDGSGHVLQHIKYDNANGATTRTNNKES